MPMDRIAEFWSRVERSLFPHLEECLPEQTEKHRELALVLELVRVEEHVRHGQFQWLGRKRIDRKALARAYVAKACYNLPTTVALIDRLQADRALREICGFRTRSEVPSEATFSRTFSEFAETSLADKAHEALVKLYLGEEVIWHVSRDSTAIEGRERPVEKRAKEGKARHRRGRPRRGEERPKPPPSRMERQYEQSADDAISELPTACDVGTKIDSKGSKRHWVGYKFHVDIGDDGIPLSAVTTSASVHDSQAAIPMMKMTAERVVSLYDLMDSAYDAKLIEKVSRELGHVPIIKPHEGRRHKKVLLEPDRERRYAKRTACERFNARLKDDCGGENVRVRGHAKVHAHLMFGLLIIFAETVLGLVT
jgi:hypothetical protein